MIVRAHRNVIVLNSDVNHTNIAFSVVSQISRGYEHILWTTAARAIFREYQHTDPEFSSLKLHFHGGVRLGEGSNSHEQTTMRLSRELEGGLSTGERLIGSQNVHSEKATSSWEK